MTGVSSARQATFLPVHLAGRRRDHPAGVIPRHRSACHRGRAQPESGGDMSDGTDGGTDLRGDATEATRAANAEMAAGLDFADRRDFEEAARGLIAPLPDGGKVLGADGGPVWDLSRFALHRGRRRPPTRSTRACGASRSSSSRAGCTRSSPASTRCARSTSRTSRSSRATTGIIVFDPLISTETAQRGAGALLRSTARASRSSRSIYSHSHVDHYGGVARHRRRGRRPRRQGQVIAPVGFLEAAVSRERARRERDEPPRQLHVRQPAARRTQGSGRRRARDDHVARHVSCSRRPSTSPRPASG